MLPRALPALAVGSLLTVILLFRHDLRELAVLARNYATFYPYLAHHEDVLYRFPTRKGSAIEAHENGSVPPIIHRNLPLEGPEIDVSRFEQNLESCRSIHLNWTHLIWTEEGASAFMQDYYPELLPLYMRAGDGAERTNMLKYALLETYGGVYLDLEAMCIKPLDELRNLPLVTLGAYPAGVDESFILSRPNHPLLRQLLGRVERRAARWSLPLTAGLLSRKSVYFTNDFMRYTRSLWRTCEGVTPPAADRTYILADRKGKLESHMLLAGVSTPLFRHRQGDVSYGWETTSVFMVSRHWIYFVAMMSLGAAFTSIWLRKSSKRWARRQHNAAGLEKGLGKMEKYGDGESLESRVAEKC